MAIELTVSQLKKHLSIEELSFNSEDEFNDNSEMIGQGRGVRSLTFGLNVKNKGYNIYVSGSPGTGKTTFAKYFAEQVAANEKIPPDICYIYNYKQPKIHKVLKLPSGSGKIFQKDMEELIDLLLTELPRVLALKDSDDKKAEIVKVYQTKRDDILKIISEEAKEQNFGVKTTNSGMYFMPIIKGQIISEEQYEELNQEEKEGISEISETIQQKAAEVMRSIREFEKQTRTEIDEVEYTIALFEVSRHMSPLLEKYSDNEEIIDFLLQTKEDILENLSDFLEDDLEEEDSLQSILPWYTKKSTEEGFSKYKVNLLIDNSELKGAPVIVDFNPTYTNLIGEVEYDNEYGNLTTDFMKIKPGLLHKANGGYLILQAYDVLTSIHGWEALRRVIKTGEIVIEPLREYTTGLAVSGIKPEPVKVDLKVILVGTDFFYQLISDYDDEFKKQFKILAEFDYEMDSNEKNIKELVNFIKKFEKSQNTKTFDMSAIIKVLEFSSRIVERQDKLTTELGIISDILLEASVWAEMDNADIITGHFIKKAISEREYRYSMYEEKLNDMIDTNLLLIDTCGGKVGQINGLAVIDTGDYAFAKPTRITATSYVGKAGIVNIEKEAEMSGCIHDKGIQVLIGYLGQVYAQEFPLSLSCRLCFEQNYSGIDGDSASSTELYAVLSSLSGLPISQEIAVTGSINQHGEIQPIGGVTYKIEGFFDLCKKRGLTGDQGVIIPIQNIKDLTLKDDVIEAVEKKQFHIYAVENVDEGIEILTKTSAGIKNEKGKFPGDSVHGKVMKKLKDFYKKAINE